MTKNVLRDWEWARAPDRWPRPRRGCPADRYRDPLGNTL